MTRFSVGFWDRLFGQRVAVDVATSQGEMVRHRVTEKWRLSMEARGEIVGINPSEHARRLISVIQLGVGASAIDLADSDPTLRWVLNRMEVWILCLTASSIGLATTQERENDGMIEAIDRLVSQESPALREAIADFLKFITDKSVGSQTELFPARIGLWVLWNVKGTSDAPDGEDTLAAPRVGHYCHRIASTWDGVAI